LPGHEFSGVIESVPPGIRDFGPGDSVYALADFPRNGAAAEYVAVRVSNLALKPRSIDHVHSAAATLSGLTAWQALFTHAGLERGQKILICGAAGGVGTFAVQLAHWKGAHVITTSSGANLDFLRGLGADQTIDYTRQPRFEDQLREHNARGLFFIVEPNRDQLEEMAKLIDDGSLETFVASIFPLSRAREAFELGLQGHTRGKIVLEVRDDTLPT
jgi:NADPH:quinone reductase-like Zn-dependent oxidoreductase